MWCGHSFRKRFRFKNYWYRRWRHETEHFGIESCVLAECLGFGVRKTILKVQTPPPALLVELRHVIASQNQFFANISRFMRPRGKIVGIENVPREISYKIGYSRVSLDVSISLKIQSSKYKLRFLPYFTLSVTFLRISRDLWVLGSWYSSWKSILGKSLQSYSLYLPFDLKKKLLKTIKIKIFAFFHV